MNTYSKYANNEEIKERLTKIDNLTTIGRSGIPILSDEKNLYIDDKDSHNLVIGSTGSGKTVTTVLPQLRMSIIAGESIVAIDEMGELHEKLADELQKRDYQVIVLNFQDANKGNNFNPLLIPYHLYKEGNEDQAIQLVSNIAQTLYTNEKSESDPFWINAARDYFMGLTLYLFDNAKEEEINFNSIYTLSNDIETKNLSQNILSNLDSISPAAIYLTTTLLAPMETRGGIISVFRQILGTITNRPNFAEMLSSSDYDLEKIINDKFALFIVGEPVISTTNKFMSIAIREIYDLVNINGKLKKRMNIILDRFTELTPIISFHNILSRSRSLNMRFTILIDSLSTLEIVYGKEESLLITNNISTLIYLLTNDDETIRRISNLAGLEQEKTPLISAQELKTLKMFEAIVFKTREYPIRTTLVPDYRLPWDMSNIEVELPKRIKKEIKLFTI